jgi:hypothetical protein
VTPGFLRRCRCSFRDVSVPHRLDRQPVAFCSGKKDAGIHARRVEAALLTHLLDESCTMAIETPTAGESHEPDSSMTAWPGERHPTRVSNGLIQQSGGSILTCIVYSGMLTRGPTCPKPLSLTASPWHYSIAKDQIEKACL